MRFYGQLLIFVLLLITNARVIFIRKAKRDSLVILAPISLLLAVIQIFSFGFDWYTITGLFLSLLVFFSNFHALYRYSEKLYVDHYSPLMMFWSILTITLSVLVIIVAVIFSPVEYKSEKLGVTETNLRYKGAFRSGFEPALNYNKTDAQIFEFTKIPEMKSRRDVVLFVPDKRGDTWYYRPYLQHLAASGFTVCSADYFTDDSNWTSPIGKSKLSRRIVMVFWGMSNKFKFMSQKEFYTYNITQELNWSVKLLSERYGQDCRFFLISDVMGNDAVADFAKLNPEKVSGFFYLDTIEEYSTPGYGVIAQTDPMLAIFNGVKKDFDGFYTKYLVLKTSEAIKTAWGIKK